MRIFVLIFFMRKLRQILLLILLITFSSLFTAGAQCSICTKTASQMGEKPAKALNGGILYLMFTPLAVAAYIGMRWWMKEKEIMKGE